MSWIKNILSNAGAYWFGFSTLVIAFLVLYLQRKNAKIEDLLYEVRSKELAAKLAVIKDKRFKDVEDYEKSKKKYLDLVNNNRALFDKYGVDTNWSRRNNPGM